ncbi:hypothetical protein [Psychroflexus sp. ALD_RP9]|uniref:hypothetical protein n=1 Tax=Psychroflexus sp. ALD_RP9 TaxID=2777186 RepID=UPI001A8F1192|nr:hypothetical protein [Psychroflexus sp. ALD_RP9]QSS97836.1 hypothetical protein IMZ30_03755 [Psychroflexus sp. ALD_RP9]
MKNIILMLFLLINFVSLAQNEIEETTLVEPNFSSESVTINDSSDIMIFKGKVSFKSDLMNLTRAEKIVYNKKTNRLVAYGVNEFTFDGKVQISRNNKNKILKYTIGERTAYVE